MKCKLRTSALSCSLFRGSQRAFAFTLVEAMLAVLIAGTALTVLYAAAAKGVAIAKKSKEYETARTLLALVELEEPIQLDDIDDDRDSGSFGSDYRGYTWEREIVEYGKEEDEMFLITTRVKWKSMNRILKEETNEIIHVPTAKKGGWVDDNATGSRR